MTGDCKGDQGFPVVAFLWDMPAPEVKMRVMFRRCTACGRLDASELSWIDPKNLWCQACLSQDIVPLAFTAGHKQWQCLDCHSISGELELVV
jgi:hypothetical protein